MIKKIIVILLILAVLLPLTVSASSPAPTLGVNYNYTGSSYFDTSLIKTYQTSRLLAQSQLATMYGNGARSIRLQVRFWHGGEAPGNLFIPSLGGVMPEPFRQNFIDIMTDFKAAGYQKVIIAFVPILENDPMQSFGTDMLHPYDSTRFAENWAFMQDVRGLTKQYGPSSEFDLLNEGTPWDTLPIVIRDQLTAYDTAMIQAYNTAYGFSDACISFQAHITAMTLPRLLAIHQAAGVYPAKWCVTSYPPNPTSASTLSTFQGIDNILITAGRTEPLSITETYYNNRNTALGLYRFMTQSNRGVVDLIEWPIMGDFVTLVNAPYVLNEYVSLAAMFPPQPTPTPIPQVPMVITYTALWTGATPWFIWFSQTGVMVTDKVILLDTNKTVWAQLDLIAGVGGSAGTFNFQLPSNVPPSGCNIGHPCTIYYYLNRNGQTSAQQAIVLQAQ